MKYHRGVDHATTLYSMNWYTALGAGGLDGNDLLCKTL